MFHKFSPQEQENFPDYYKSTISEKLPDYNPETYKRLKNTFPNTYHSSPTKQMQILIFQEKVVSSQSLQYQLIATCCIEVSHCT